MNTTLTVLDWNADAKTPGRSREKIELLQRASWDIAILQEVKPVMWRAMQRVGIQGCFSLDLVTDSPGNAWFGNVVVARSDITLSDQHLIPIDMRGKDPPTGFFPARLMSVSARTPLGHLGVVAYHADYTRRDITIMCIFW